MHITYFLTTCEAIGGTERAAITQANMFVRAGDSVTILSVYRESGTPAFDVDPRVQLEYLVQLPTGEAGQLLVERIAKLGGPSRLIPPKWDNQFSAESDLAVVRTLPTLTTDVLVTTTPALTALASEFAPPETVIVEQEHRATMHRIPDQLAPLELHASRIDALVSLTSRGTEWLTDHLGEAAPRLVTIPNSIPEGFYPRADLDARVIMAAGRLQSGKNFEGLIRAFSAVNDRATGWRLRIYGQGPAERQLRALIRTLRLENSVELVPPVPDMISEWSKAAVFAMSSRSEGLPLVALEAMAAGLPLVAFDCETGPAEIIDPDVNGLLVPQGDITALAEALFTLMSDEALRERYSAGSLGRVERFSTSAVHALWRELFTRLIGERDAVPMRVERSLKRITTKTDQPESTVSRYASLASAATPATRSLRDLTPESVTTGNFVTAQAMLSGAGIPHFWVPGTAPTREVLAVPATQQSAVLSALASHAQPALAVFPMAGNSRLLVEPWRPGRGGALSPLFGRATVLRVFEEAHDRTGSLQTSHTRGCDIEFWPENDDGLLQAPRPNQMVDLVQPNALRSLVAVDVRGVRTPTLPLVADTVPWQQPTFDIDAVYTWVDDTDPDWAEQRLAAQAAVSGLLHAESTSAARFRNRDELRYSLRSLDAFVPWVRRVYLVTAGQRPSWLVDHPDIEVVDHRDIFPDTALPTFNSHAIEAVMHRISGLSEHYLYLNDDVMFASTQLPSTYHEANGQTRFFPSPVKINDLGAQSPPHLTAAGNNRRLIQRDFGITISQSMLHVPSAQRRSIGYEIEERYPQEWRATVHAAFRSPTDISIPSSLAHYLAYATGRATPSRMTYRFLGLGAPDLSRRMTQILRSVDVDIVALGDPPGGVRDPNHIDSLLDNFLNQLLPWPSRFEALSAELRPS